MERFTFIFLLLAPATALYANPIIVRAEHPAVVIVFIAALLLEICVTTGVLLFSNMEPKPTFFALVVVNLISYFGILTPLISHFEVPVIAAEIIIVIIETIFIKLISLIPSLQGDNFKILKWRYALLAATLGNIASYYASILIK